MRTSTEIDRGQGVRVDFGAKLSKAVCRIVDLDVAEFCNADIGSARTAIDQIDAIRWVESPEFTESCGITTTVLPWPQADRRRLGPLAVASCRRLATSAHQ